MPDHMIRDITDYGIFAVPDSETSQPIPALVNYGPLPTVCSLDIMLMSRILIMMLGWPRACRVDSRALP